MKRCPKCGHGEFYVTVHVTQAWIVDGDEQYLKTVEDFIETTHFPDNEDLWECAKCGYEDDGSKFELVNSLDSIANDIVMELEHRGFDNITDSSGCFTLREFSDGLERCVDVYKSTNDGKPHYVVYCSYEDESFDYKYTDDLTVEALEEVLTEVYEED